MACILLIGIYILDNKVLSMLLVEGPETSVFIGFEKI